MREGKEKPAAQLVEASRAGPHEARAKEVIASHVKKRSRCSRVCRVAMFSRDHDVREFYRSQREIFVPRYSSE